MASARRKRKRATAARRNAATPTSSGVDVEGLQRELGEVRKKLEAADAAKSRAVSRGTAKLRKENEMLEAQLTRLVQEIGQLRFVVDRVQQLERELREKDLRISEAEAETDRLREALNSGRPTARAAAAASQAARLFGTGR